ncbi:MAG: guanine deaminase [Saccharofermentanales bacterium]
MDPVQIYKGNFIYSASPNRLTVYEDSYLIIKEGKVEEICGTLPQQYLKYPVTDLQDKLVIPGFADMHVHAPQFDQRGLGMDKKLFEWLSDYTFATESRFKDIGHARDVYTRFADQLVRQGTLHACIYATIHKESTALLFEILESKGIRAFVGKVNMDINCPASLKEKAQESLDDTEDLILRYQNNRQVKPILTPRFVPTCSDALLKGLGTLAQKYGTPVQSHLAENMEEIRVVEKMHPDEKSYSDVYNHYGLFGQSPTLMAHCVHLTDKEKSMMIDNHVIAVHCPDSNLNLISGIMPVRKMLDAGIPVVLGSDVGGGHNLSMARVIVSAIQQSKVMALMNPDTEPLTLEEVFYMATRGGGSFFGKTGSFAKGSPFDALLVDDTQLGNPGLTLHERLQRFIYTGDDRNITARFVEGKKIG